MTILNATIARDFAIVGQDTCIMGVTGKLLGFSRKPLVLDDKHMLIAGTGSLLFLLTWAGKVRTMPGDVIELNTIAPVALRELRDQLPEDAREFTALHVGYSHRHQMLAGFAYQSGNDFEPEAFGPETGHVLMPAELDTADAGYDDLAALWTPAAMGIRTEEFHTRLAVNQHAAMKRGLLRQTAGVGGVLHLTHIDVHGITSRPVMEFPGYQEQLASLPQVNGRYMNAGEALKASMVGTAA